MTTVNDLRTSFLQFFRERNHKIVPSSSLLPKDDPTLLFTTAGMVQFKPMFAGTVELEYTRAATVQKCFRTSDLENVGKTKRHLTFFEMLGNFSFGDYFKKEAIEFAWDFSRQVVGFPAEKIWVSIYENDDEAFGIWNRHIGIPAEKIVRLGKKDNFWGPAGDSGACGPCSELYFDRGESFGCGGKDCKPGCECERFLEYWNLVFNQFNQTISGELLPLPRTGIDTGMGLERLASLVQNVESVYRTDEFVKLIDFVSASTGKKYEGANVIPISVIVEHARALTFAMADGIYPSNDGRGYVLRRLLRRALRFTRQLGLHEPFVYQVVDPLVKSLGGFYPELVDASKNVKSVIEAEEKRFLETLENGMDRLEEIMKSLKQKGEKTLSGEHAFILHDTFGFPLEMTAEIAEEKGLAVDIAGYQREMEKQRERGKQSWKSADTDLTRVFEDCAKNAGESVFTGYGEETTDTTIALMHDGSRVVEKLAMGQKGFMVLVKTPFYGESGGQVGDSGTITGPGGASFEVQETRKYNNVFIHVGAVVNGSFVKGAAVTAKIDIIRRNLIRANHTATHLLQAALRGTLGTHVKQAGSLVEPERLRFDFSHFSGMTQEEMERVEKIVNEKIWENIPVKTDIMPVDDAVKSGAMAVFDEKYEDMVRVVQVDGFSRELCGGTHAASTGQIGVFKIIKESSPGAGMRRIEAITLKSLLDRFNEQSRILQELVQTTNVTEDVLLKRIDEIVERNRNLEKELERRTKENLAAGVDQLIAGAQSAQGVKIIAHVFDGVDADALRSLSDSIRSREQNTAVLFGSANDGKALLLFAATAPAVQKGIDCGLLVKETAPMVGGGGGGRKDMAQAGGKNAAALKEAIESAAQRAKKMVEK